MSDRQAAAPLDVLGQMLRLPFSFFVCCMEMMVQTLRGLQVSADQGLNTLIPNRTPAAPADTPAGTVGAAVPLSSEPNLGARAPGATATKESKRMSDKDLSNDLVKLVSYSIVSIERDRERKLYEGEKIVTDNMTGEAFATWMIAEFVQEYPHRVTHEEKKYLRVYYSVLDSWVRESLHYEQKQLDILAGIERAIRDCCPPRTEQASSSAPTAAP